jgi:hypothetical protein
MLDNTTWFENRWHKSKIGSSVDKISISEEIIWGSPEAVWIFISQAPHLVSASSGVRLFHVGWSSNQELNFVFKFVDDMLSDVKNQVDTFLSSHSTNEGEYWDRVIKVLKVEVFLLN